ncbi:MAG: flagellar export protein FliJ [Limnobacter sp.]|nr:flagellar export protein FliJ [Limnobacter sp.]
MNAIDILLEKAEEHAVDAGKTLARTRQKLAQAKDKLAMLQSYQQECQANMHAIAVQGVSGFQLRNQNAFGGKIEMAVQQQTRELEFLERTQAHQLGVWQAAMVEQKKFEALKERARQKAMQLAEKREQKMNDEYAARIARVNAGEIS